MLATCKRRMFTGDRDRAILLCLLDTGYRAAEFLALNVGDLNLSSGAALVRRGKGGKFRTVFLGGKSRRAAARYLRHRGDLRCKPAMGHQAGDQAHLCGPASDDAASGQTCGGASTKPTLVPAGLRLAEPAGGLRLGEFAAAHGPQRPIGHIALLAPDRGRPAAGAREDGASGPWPEELMDRRLD